MKEKVQKMQQESSDEFVTEHVVWNVMKFVRRKHSWDDFHRGKKHLSRMESMK
jgi:hypothetical protein